MSRLLPGALLLLAGSLLFACQGGSRTDPTSVDTDEHVVLEEDPGDVEGAVGDGREDRRVVRRVFVDAGHGGHDDGALGPSGSREKDVVLDISNRLARVLEGRLGLETVISRSDDTFIPLRQRAILANESDADLFLSIHANSAVSSVAGVEVFTLDVASDESAERLARQENELAGLAGEEMDLILGDLALIGNATYSRPLATNIQSALVSRLRGLYGEGEVVDRGARSALFYVLVGAEMPAALIEVGFLTHPEEERRLRTPAHRQLVAEGIADGVEGYLAWLATSGTPQ